MTITGVYNVSPGTTGRPMTSAADVMTDVITLISDDTNASTTGDVTSDYPDSGTTSPTSDQTVPGTSQGSATSVPWTSEWNSAATETSAPSNPELSASSLSAVTSNPGLASSSSGSVATADPSAFTSSRTSVTSPLTTHSSMTSDPTTNSSFTSAPTTPPGAITSTSQLQVTITDNYTTEMNPGESGLSHGAIVGLSVGVSLAVVVVVVVVIVVVMVLRNRNKSRRAKHNGGEDNPNDYKLDIHKDTAVNSPTTLGRQNFIFDQQIPETLSTDMDKTKEVNDNNMSDNGEVMLRIRPNNGTLDKEMIQDSRMSLGPLLLDADDPTTSKQMLSDMMTTNTFK